MKIQKKFALQILEFVILFLRNGYYPYDDMECHLISKTLAFGKHHNMVSDEFIDQYTGKGHKPIGLKNLKTTARLDLTDVEGEAIISMMEEMSNDSNIDFEIDPPHKGLTHYLNKQVVK